METKLFVAMQALILHKNKVLLVRESSKYRDGTNAGKFNVVGGRVKLGERFDEGLCREVQEETGLTISIGRPFFVGEWRPQVRNEQWQIVGVFFECTSESDKVILGEEHDDFAWINPADYKNYNLIDDLFPMFEVYLKVCI